MTTPAHKWREAPEEIRAKCRSICGENDINNENEDVFMYLRKEIDTATDMAYQAGLDTHSAHLVERIEALMEQLAEIEHDRWSRWQEWCHKVLRENCPSPELEKVLERWDRQIATPYLELSEAEKESDREQVRPYLELITKTISDQAIDIVKGTQRN